MRMSLAAKTSKRQTPFTIFEEAPISLFEIVVGVALGQTAVVLAYIVPGLLNHLLGF